MLVDDAAGFAGFDANGQSENPVIFRAPADAPTELFVQVLLDLLEAKVVKVTAELARPGQAALGCEVELPRDESLGPNRDNRLVFDAAGDGGVLTWQVRMAFYGRRGKGALGSATRAEDWAARPFGERHASLLRAAQEVAKGFEYHDATVTWNPSPHPPAWGPVYEALAVIADLNTARRNADGYAPLISTWVYEFAEPPQAGPEDPPRDPNALPAPTPEDLGD